MSNRQAAAATAAVRRAVMFALESRVLLATVSGPSVQPLDLVDVNGTLFFTAAEAATGRELWKSNGTAGGTGLVKDIVPGAAGSHPAHLTAVANTLLMFTGDQQFGGLSVQMWRSDGTAAGTTLVKDFSADLGQPGTVSEAVAVGNELFFTTDAGGRRWLWKSDGTTAGTEVVAEPGFPKSLTAAGDTLFFTAGVSENELWKSDGTRAGTVQVMDIAPGDDVHFVDPEEHPNEVERIPFSSDPQSLTNVDGTLFFVAYDTIVPRPFPDSSSSGYTTNGELWKSDGTHAGTVRVKDIIPGRENSFPRNLTNVNGTLYFTAFDGTGDEELWRSDGTDAGTVRVKDIVPGADSSSPRELTDVNGTLFFTADDGAHSRELWRSDGTAAGTVMIKDADAGVLGSFPLDLVNVNGTLFFHADAGADGRELWKSDGTAGGTVLVKDIRAGASGASPAELTAAHGTIFFSAHDGMHGRELWTSNGRASGTVMLTDQRPPPAAVTVTGNDGADALLLNVADGKLQVFDGGKVVEAFPLADVTSVVVQTFAGDDVIDCSTIALPSFVQAGNGNDRVSTGAAADTIDAGDGDDSVWGNDAGDKIAGGDGADYLNGGAQKDTIDGGIGNDRLNGNGGHDRLFGGPNADRLFGYDGNDMLEGGSSNDRLEGGNGIDTMYGVGGNDRFFAARDSAIDQLFGGKGEDSAVADATDVLTDIELATD